MSTMKPRSGLVTDGLERAPARGMLRAVGMGDDDWVKPQIGIVSSWNEITPCNLSLDRLAKASRQGVIDARAVTDVLNNSTNRGTNGAANLVYL